MCPPFPPPPPLPVAESLNEECIHVYKHKAYRYLLCISRALWNCGCQLVLTQQVVFFLCNRLLQVFVPKIEQFTLWYVVYCTA